MADLAATSVPIDPGSLVTHRTRADWGTGLVIGAGKGLDKSITVRFADGDRLFRDGRGMFTLAPEGATPPPKPPVASLRPSTRRSTAAPAPSRYPSIESALAKFRAEFSGGFADDRYIKTERREKWGAHEQFVERLGGGSGGCQRGRALLGGTAEDLATLRAHLQSIASSVRYMSPYEQAAFRDGLKAPEEVAVYARALFDLLEGASTAQHAEESLWTAYCRAIASLPAPRGSLCRWPIATTLPGSAMPTVFAVLKPEVTKWAAAGWLAGLKHGTRVSLNYRADPNWLTYRQFLSMSKELLDLLRPEGAVDFLDVHSFIWVVEHYHRNG